MFNGLYEAATRKNGEPRKYSLELLSFLGLTPNDVGRYRDCYLSKDGKTIIVYTRNGGGNRDNYQDVFNQLSSHPNYITDYDDEYDETFASIEFSVPSEYTEQVSLMLKDADTLTGAEKFAEAMHDLETNSDKYFKEHPAIVDIFNKLDEVFTNGTDKPVSVGGVTIVPISGAEDGQD